MAGYLATIPPEVILQSIQIGPFFPIKTMRDFEVVMETRVEYYLVMFYNRKHTFYWEP